MKRYAFTVSLSYECPALGRLVRTDVTTIDADLVRAIERAKEAVGDHSAHVTSVTRRLCQERIEDHVSRE